MFNNNKKANIVSNSRADLNIEKLGRKTVDEVKEEMLKLKRKPNTILKNNALNRKTKISGLNRIKRNENR